MVNTSNEYKRVIRESGKKQYVTATINLVDNTILNVSNDSIMENGLIINDGTSGNGTFEIGSAIINQCKLVLNNFYDDYSSYDFDSVIIRPSIGLQLSDRIETIRKGVFTVTSAKAIGSTIVLTALDNMYKFDKPFSEVNITYPITAFSLLYAVCLHCGVSLATVNFTNMDFIIIHELDDEAITCREVVAWIAQISGSFARCNTSGALELKWYDIGAFEQSDSLDGGKFDKAKSVSYQTGDSANGGNFTDYDSGDNVDGGTFLQMERYHHIYALNQATIDTDDIIITGIQVKAMGTTEDYGETVLFGSKGYVIEITDNPLITENKASIIANSVGAKLVGMRFRPLSITVLSDPSIEAGDVAHVTDKKGNSYHTLITNISYTIGNYENITCDAETPNKKQSVRFSPETKVIVEARKDIENKLTTYDIAMQQLTNLITNGFGLFKTETVDSNGGIIYYMHDQPTMDESLYRWFMTSGGMIEQKKISGVWTTVAAVDNEGNALFNVITARGLNADWVRTGKLQSVDNSVVIDLDNGNFTFSDSNGQALITPNGVANSDNFQAADNIANGYPLKMPFNIDDSVSIITSVKLKWTIDKFRTYSRGSSSGGGTSTTSDTAYAFTVGSNASSVNVSGSTNSTIGASGQEHYHSVSLSGGSHSHYVDLPSHNHDISIGSHSHGVSYGILESNVTDTIIKVLVDGVERATLTSVQGEIDLSQWVTVPGWHTIEITSATLKRVSAQVNIKSYIRR